MANKCKCGHERKRHMFLSWLPSACWECKCDDFDVASE